MFNQSCGLIEVTDENGNTTSYTYDAAGNITSFTSGNESGTMGYDSKNRLTSYKGTAITYDADGNMSVGVLGTAAASFQYDSANRLISATGTTYQYDNEGNRIQSQTSEQTLTYVYDTTGSMSRMLMSKTQGGAITKYIYGNGLIAQENSSGYYSYHYDLRGSTIALTNASGTVTNTYAYDTYGTVTKKTGTLTVLFLYNGRDGVVTDSNGFLYMRARYYSPQLKRFINADVVVGSIQESPTLNRYAYVNGNPISYVDPFGLSAEPGSNWVDTGHMVLDILGLLPVVGGIFDGTNVIWYLLAGDLVNAGFSATAFLPIIGDAAGAGKLLHNAGSKVGSQAAEIFAKYGDDVAKWADDILGFAKKEGLELALADGGSVKFLNKSGKELANKSTIQGLFKAGIFDNTDKNILRKRYEDHVFSSNHRKGGIMELGKDRDDIWNNGLNIIKEMDQKGMIKEGPTQIKAYMNGKKVELKVFVKQGIITSFDMFKGWSGRDMGNTIYY